MPPPLHFPRPQFTFDTYSAMASGFDPHRSLFGPRRIGKTSFLLNDLAPKAQEFGHRVAYVDFWRRGPAPLAVLLYELDQTLAQKTGMTRVLAGAKGLAPRVTLLALGAEATLDLTAKPKSIPEDQILLLGQYLSRLANPNRPTFLLLDEFQELARTPDSATLIAALREGLNRHPGGFATLFTGSSQARLKQIFNKRSAPFFRFATPLTLPPLGLEFVRHQLGFYPKHAAPVSEAEALAVFDRFGGNPDYFQRWMRNRAVLPDMTSAEVADLVAGDLSEQLEFETTWLGLTDIHRLVLRLVAEGISEIYSAPARARIHDLTGTEAPTDAQIQTAFNTLENRDLVDSWDGERLITDPVFQSWITERPVSDFT